MEKHGRHERQADSLIHDYMGVDYAIIWDVVKNIIPILKTQIEMIIENEKTSSL